jgi:hypothetical protein
MVGRQGKRWALDSDDPGTAPQIGTLGNPKGFEQWSLAESICSRAASSTRLISPLGRSKPAICPGGAEVFGVYFWKAIAAGALDGGNLVFTSMTDVSELGQENGEA